MTKTTFADGSVPAEYAAFRIHDALLTRLSNDGMQVHVDGLTARLFGKIPLHVCSRDGHLGDDFGYVNESESHSLPGTATKDSLVIIDEVSMNYQRSLRSSSAVGPPLKKELVCHTLSPSRCWAERCVTLSSPG